MFEFTIFRIPVRVEPWFWVIGFFLGNGMRIHDRESLLGTLMWMVVVFISILIHELGHAMTSRKFTGVEPSIRLWGMGGLAYPNAKLTNKESFWVTLAGPLAGLVFFLVVILFCVLQFGRTAGMDIIKWFVYPGFKPGMEAILVFMDMHWVTFDLLRSLVFVNFWWSLVNLLPVHPLDGGQIYATFEKSERKVHQVGTVTGIAVAIVGWFVFKDWWICLIFGYLAYQNFQRYKAITGWRR